MKKILLITLLWTISLMLFSCEDKLTIEENEIVSPLTIYGQQTEIKSAVAWVAKKTDLFQKRDTTVNLQWLNPATNKNEVLPISGFLCGSEIEIGNIMLCFYGEGLKVDKDQNMAVGSGQCISLHLRTSDPENIVPGTYSFSNKTDEPFVFIGYYSSNYSTTLNTNNIAEIKEGVVKVEKEDKKYRISVQCKVAAGTDINCQYYGEIEKVLLEQKSFVYNKGIKMTGVIQFPYTTQVIVPANPYLTLHPNDWWTFYNPTVNPRVNTNPTYQQSDTGYDTSSPGILDLRKTAAVTATSATSTGSNQSLNESQSVVLIYNYITRELMFISPLDFINYMTKSITITINGERRPRYILPCHTEYMKAPSNFSQTDFDNYTVSDFPKNFKNETVKFKATSNDFTPGYVFFKDGNGTKGIFKVRDLALPASEYEVLISSIAQRRPASVSILMDIKYPGKPIPNPKIR